MVNIDTLKSRDGIYSWSLMESGLVTRQAHQHPYPFFGADIVPAHVTAARLGGGTTAWRAVQPPAVSAVSRVSCQPSAASAFSTVCRQPRQPSPPSAVSRLNVQPSAVSRQPSAVSAVSRHNVQPSAVSRQPCQPSAVSTFSRQPSQRSAVSRQPSAVSRHADWRWCDAGCRNLSYNQPATLPESFGNLKVEGVL